MAHCRSIGHLVSEDLRRVILVRGILPKNEGYIILNAFVVHQEEKIHLLVNLSIQ